MKLKYLLIPVLFGLFVTVYYLAKTDNYYPAQIEPEEIDISNCQPNYTLEPEWLDIKDVNGIGYKYVKNKVCLDGSKVKYFVIEDVGYSDTGGEPIDDSIYFCKGDNQYIASGSRGLWGGMMMFEGKPCK